MSAAPQPNVVNFDKEIENQHLAEEHGLTKTTAYIRRSTDQKRSAGAARTAKCRKNKKEQGLVQVYLPIAAAEAIKSAGSFEAWMAKLQPRISEQWLNRVLQLARLGLKVEKLPGWLRWTLGL